MNTGDIVWASAIGGITGSGFAATLMHFIKGSWLEKIKAHYATELESFKDSLQIEQKRIQARVDRSIFVSRAQFDTEFNAMKDIFRFATDLKLTMDQIRPMFGLSPR